MKYKNKVTGEVVVVDSYALKYMVENNGNFEKIEEVKEVQKPILKNNNKKKEVLKDED